MELLDRSERAGGLQLVWSIAFSFGLAGCLQEPPVIHGPVATEAVAAPAGRTQVDTIKHEVFVGVVIASRAVEVSPVLQGRVRGLRVGLGDTVREGAELAQLDAPSITAADLRMVRADLRSAVSEADRLALELSRAQSRAARAASLAEQGLVSAEELDDARFEERIAAARVTIATSLVAQRRAVVEQHEIVFSHLSLRAPFEGVVAAVYADVGGLTGPTAPLLRLLDLRSLRLRFGLPTASQSLVHRGDVVSATVDDSLIRLKGIVDRIAPELDSASQLFVVEASLDAVPSEEARRIVGRIARVSLERGLEGHVP